MYPLKTGTLAKRGGGYPYSWQEWSFSLFGDRIEYSKGPLKERMGLRSARVERTSEKYGFRVITRERGDSMGQGGMFGAMGSAGEQTLWCAAPSEEAADSWVAALEGVVGASDEDSEEGSEHRLLSLTLSPFKERMSNYNRIASAHPPSASHSPATTSASHSPPTTSASHSPPTAIHNHPQPPTIIHDHPQCSASQPPY
eukprot:CAMPEP_0173282624 /NCGR_PEP_ID=MMETSP1143-20121109/6925_1 /TAXON_ID=483371 /ORGANISM="non described non described, Strain CCMP2298" /LENGTH=198 /DNA_ID=CAMNT_0014220219 /DNA_START=196 /DNA_END=789 /DNA_ORIENTATION=+